MSVFAVWGMTYAHAFGLAQKKTRTIDNKGNLIPEPDWLKLVHEAAEIIMAGQMIRQLSTKFDAPQFAKEFMEIASRMQRHRNLQIRVWKPLTDDVGKPIYSKNSKKPRMGWHPYEP